MFINPNHEFSFAYALGEEERKEWNGGVIGKPFSGVNRPETPEWPRAETGRKPARPRMETGLALAFAEIGGPDFPFGV
jgi:hypothetical protein